MITNKEVDDTGKLIDLYNEYKPNNKPTNYLNFLKYINKNYPELSYTFHKRNLRQCIQAYIRSKREDYEDEELI